MKRACKNCEWTRNETCVHTKQKEISGENDSLYQFNPKVPKTYFCENFFPHNPTCNQCRFYGVLVGSGFYCYVDPTIAQRESLYGCSRFQPNGEGE